MDYSVIRTQAMNAFKYYKSDDNKYTESMKNLYTEGKKNPSVASIILDDTIMNGMKMSSEIGNEVMKDAFVSDDLSLNNHFNKMAEFEARANIATMAIKKGINAGEIPTDKNIQKLTEKQNFDKTFNKLYPYSGKIRKRTIDAHRIQMDKVTPKASWEEKITYAKTNGEYKEMYPKSLITRVALIINNQIRNNEVTKHVSGFLAKFTYSPFVDKSFHFFKTAKK